MSEEKYMLQAARVEREALKIRENIPQWHHLKTQNGVDMYYKQSPHFNGNMYKFVTSLNYPHKVVYQVLKPPPTTSERLCWDKSLKHYDRLATISEDLAIGLLITPTAAWGAISKREFVDLYIYKTFAKDSLNTDYGEISWIFAESVEFSSRPITDDYVRGKNYPAGYAVAEDKWDSNKCHLEFYVNCDVGGMLPRSLVEAALPSQQISFIKNVKEEVKRRVARA